MFVTFEGLDGSGTTTHSELLRRHLEESGREVVLTREPGGTDLGERVRELVLGDTRISPWAEAALFAAARTELVDRVIGPALYAGQDVVSDRYVDSSLAYQGFARDLGIEEVYELNRVATRNLLPDFTFVLEIDPDTSAERVGKSPDRIEREGREFRQRVADGYRIVAGKYADRVVLLDGTRPPDQLHEEIRGHLREHF